MIRIITDSTCDIDRKECKALDITVVPLTINFDNRIYKDGIDLTHSEFYDKLRAAVKLPTTSQINPGEFETAFSQYIDQGDEIIGIFLSSDLSGTMQSAVIAANDVSPEKIFIVDSRSASFGAAILIKEAVRLRDSGQYSAPEIVKTIQKLALRLRIFAVVDTLKYLKMGGRLSGSAATIGGILGITPVIQVYDGKVEAIGKARGEHGGMKALQQQIKKYPPDLSHEVAFANSDAPERMKAYVEFLKPQLDGAKLYTSNIGSVIGTHAGPGAVGIAYFTKEND